jgi:long-chain acyl-CoA synthetase
MTLDELLARPFGSYGELIRFHARQRPNHPALIEGERRVSFATLDAMMDRVAATLQRAGIRPTEAIAICAGSSLEYAAVFLGALRAGVAVAPLAPSSTPQTIADMAANAEARLFFVDAAVADELAPVRTRIAVPWIALDESAAGTRFSNWLAPAGSQTETGGDPPRVALQHHLFLGHHRHAQGHRPAARHALGACAARPRPRLRARCGDPGVDTALLQHHAGQLLPRRGAGRHRRADAEVRGRGYLELAQRHRATHSMLVPVQYARLMAHPDFERHDLSAFRMKFCTSAPFAAALKADILRRWPGGLIEYYGMTEGGGTVVLKAHERPGQARHRRPARRGPRHPPDR